MLVFCSMISQSKIINEEKEVVQSLNATIEITNISIYPTQFRPNSPVTFRAIVTNTGDETITNNNRGILGDWESWGGNPKIIELKPGESIELNHPTIWPDDFEMHQITFYFGSVREYLYDSAIDGYPDLQVRFEVEQIGPISYEVTGYVENTGETAACFEKGDVTLRGITKKGKTNPKTRVYDYWADYNFEHKIIDVGAIVTVHDCVIYPCYDLLDVHLTLIVDPNDLVEEINEENNEYSSKIVQGRSRAHFTLLSELLLRLDKIVNNIINLK